MSFTHLIVESSSRDNENMLPYQHTHYVINSVPGFSHVSFNYNNFPPVKIKTKTQIFLLKKNMKFNVKHNIKKIINEYKNVNEPKRKSELNLDVLDKTIEKKNKKKSNS